MTNAVTRPEETDPEEAISKAVAPLATETKQAAAAAPVQRAAIYEPFDYQQGADLKGSGGTSDYGLEGKWSVTKTNGPIHSGSIAWGALPILGNCAGASANVIAFRKVSPDALQGAGSPRLVQSRPPGCRRCQSVACW